jgi:hypothetical protein
MIGILLNFFFFLLHSPALCGEKEAETLRTITCLV